LQTDAHETVNQPRAVLHSCGANVVLDVGIMVAGLTGGIARLGVHPTRIKGFCRPC